MTELRHDPITGSNVIIAENRADRPQEFATIQFGQAKVACPFCEGAEAETPAEIWSRRASDSKPDAPGWQVRVVPNKYPALLPQGNAVAGTGNGRANPLCKTQPLSGTHEVIIETPAHLERTSELNIAALTEVIKVYRDRVSALRADGQTNYATIFKNVGPNAGATIRHSHSQLMGLPIVPSLPRTMLDNVSLHRETTGECLFCEVLQQEINAEQRIVARTNSLIAYCPFAARTSYETWIVPRAHDCKFDEIDESRVAEVGRLLGRVLSRIDDVLDKPDYNYILNLAPFDISNSHTYHWHIVILPRLTTLAGFEWGSGCTINPVAPETAAGRLRIDGLLSQ
jgi:UDPglucose--hexose-1-phosphate uridylyltransferase